MRKSQLMSIRRLEQTGRRKNVNAWNAIKHSNLGKVTTVALFVITVHTGVRTERRSLAGRLITG